MTDQTQLAVRSEEPSAGQLLAAVLERGVTAESVGVVREMLQMQRELREEEAKREFAQALSALQDETGQIQAMSVVTKKGGIGELYRYAKLEDIMKRVQPLLVKHGFSFSFDTIGGDGNLTAIFELTHKSGHSKRNQFTCRVSKGLNTNSSQDDMGAKSYAKRGALCDGLGIVISQDNDARTVDHGEFVSAQIAGDLRMRFVKTKFADREAAMLKWLHAASWEEIPAHRIEDLISQVQKAERETDGDTLVDEKEAWK